MLSEQLKVGQVWEDLDPRNVDRGKTGRAKPKARRVRINSLPTLSSPGSFEVLSAAPGRGDTVGKLRSFTRAKLFSNYALVA